MSVNGIFAENGIAWGHDAKIAVEEIILESSVIPCGRGNKGKKKTHRPEYINVLSAFDIETTSISEIKQAIMYIWQWHFTNMDTGYSVTVYGRTWAEWQECVYTIRDVLPTNHYIVVLDHNLSFEFAFLTEQYPFTPDEVFATDARAVVKCTMYDHFEFRCTLRHSNTSLKTYLRQWNTEHQKLSGDEYNYNVIRYPWTQLDEKEMRYALNDVIGLCEAYIAEMKYWHDDLYTVPITSTGYVRRICKKAWSTLPYKTRLSWMPDLTVYRLLDAAFRGGDTHGSRFHSTPESVGHAVINYNVDSYDRSSSYPDVLVNCKYPLGQWYQLQRKKNEWITADEVNKYINKYEKAIVTNVHFAGLRLRDENWEMPYIPKSKCGYYENIIEDNGRILSADRLSMTITDVDWQIIEKEYQWEQVFFSDTYYCQYNYLPDCFRDVVRLFYSKKTELKGSEDSLEKIEYGLMKSLLNALYGMAAMKVLRESIYYIHDTGEYIDQIEYEISQQDHSFSEQEKREYRENTEKEMIAKHNKKAFLPFQVGVWCTAWARLELHRSLWLVHDQGGRTIYVDTDSNKCTHGIDFTALNVFYRERSIKNNAYADSRSGKRYYMGVYEHEYTAEKFSHMGAKKYIYQEQGKPGADGFHLTIAGVSKKKGAAELWKKGGFSAFCAGTVFRDGGGVQGVYNDVAYGDYHTPDGHTLYIGRNVCLLPDTYTLGLSGDYSRLLEWLMINDKITGDTMGVINDEYE